MKISFLPRKKALCVVLSILLLGVMGTARVHAQTYFTIGQLYYQINESRMVDSSLPEKAPEMSEKYKNNKASCFYTVENGIQSI